MAFLDRIAAFIPSLRKRTTSAPDPSRDRLIIPIRTQSGIRIDEDVALTYTALWAAVRFISETIAGLPWQIFDRLSDTERRRVHGTLDDRLNIRASLELDAFNWRQTLMAWALTWGNGYAEITRRGSEVTGLFPLEPNRVSIERDEAGRIIYIYHSQDGGQTTLAANDVFHLRGLGWNGLYGYSPIRMHVQSIGLGLAAENYGASFFGNGARPGGVIKHPGVLGTDGVDAVKKGWRESHQGPVNAQNVAVFEEGMEWQQVGIPPEEAQFLETRKLSVTDMARIFGVKPHKIGDLDNATFDNITEQNIESATDTMLPWARRLEQEAAFKLLTAPQRARGRFTRLNLDGLQRGNIETRFKAYALALQWGLYTRNELRAKENVNPIPDGDVILVPATHVPLQRMIAAPVKPSPNVGESPPVTALRTLLVDAMERIAKREVHRVNDVAVKYGARTEPFFFRIGKFYAEHRLYMARALKRAVGVAIETCELELDGDGLRTLDSLIADWSDVRVTRSRNELETTDIGECASLWQDGRITEDVDSLIRDVQGLLVRSANNAITEPTT